MLAVVREQGAATEHMLMQLWSFEKSEHARYIAEELDSMNFVSWQIDSGVYVLRLNDLVLEFATKKDERNEKVREYHQGLLDAYVPAA